ncbi:MAG: cell division protein FtsA, partial [Fimbriimonas ginsengisoli]|nr:cell division protein FtsA [Fimbriimonas ginsengisoli]
GSHLEGVNAQGFVPIYPRSRTITREDVLQVINHSRQVVLPPDREQIEAIPREFRIDGQRGIQRPIGMSGGRLEVVTYLVTGQTTHLQNVEKAVSMAGRQVEQMVLQPLASGLGVLTAEELDLGVVVADVGGGTTDVAVFSGGSIAFSASLPIGGQLVTSDLSKLLKTSPDEAERLKTEAGCALARLVGEKESVTVTQLGQAEARPLQRRVLCEIIESRMREIAKMVWQQIERSGLNGMLPGGIVLTGGGSRLSGSADLFGDVLKNMRVRVGEPDVDGKAHGGYSFATAVGLARYALDSFEDELVPASGVTDWKQKIRTLWSVIRT